MLNREKRHKWMDGFQEKLNSVANFLEEMNSVVSLVKKQRINDPSMMNWSLQLKDAIDKVEFTRTARTTRIAKESPCALLRLFFSEGDGRRLQSGCADAMLRPGAVLDGMAATTGKGEEKETLTLDLEEEGRGGKAACSPERRWRPDERAVLSPSLSPSGRAAPPPPRPHHTTFF
jgi:hypothetical protein